MAGCQSQLFSLVTKINKEKGKKIAKTVMAGCQSRNNYIYISFAFIAGAECLVAGC